MTGRLASSRLCCTYLGRADEAPAPASSSSCSSLEKHTLSWLSVPLDTKPSSSSLEQSGWIPKVRSVLAGLLRRTRRATIQFNDAHGRDFTGKETHETGKRRHKLLDWTSKRRSCLFTSFSNSFNRVTRTRTAFPENKVHSAPSARKRSQQNCAEQLIYLVQQERCKKKLCISGKVG